MISADMLRHQLWLMRAGYRPDRRTVRDIIDSHLEAAAEIDRLRSDSCAYDCEHCHDPRDRHPDCLRCRTA